MFDGEDDAINEHIFLKKIGKLLPTLMIAVGISFIALNLADQFDAAKISATAFNVLLLLLIIVKLNTATYSYEGSSSGPKTTFTILFIIAIVYLSIINVLDVYWALFLSCLMLFVRYGAFFYSITYDERTQKHKKLGLLTYGVILFVVFFHLMNLLIGSNIYMELGLAQNWAEEIFISVRVGLIIVLSMLPLSYYLINKDRIKKQFILIQGDGVQEFRSTPILTLIILLVPITMYLIFELFFAPNIVIEIANIQPNDIYLYSGQIPVNLYSGQMAGSQDYFTGVIYWLLQSPEPGFMLALMTFAGIVLMTSQNLPGFGPVIATLSTALLVVGPFGHVMSIIFGWIKVPQELLIYGGGLASIIFALAQAIAYTFVLVFIIVFVQIGRALSAQVTPQ